MKIVRLLLIFIFIAVNAKAQVTEEHPLFFKGYCTQPVDVAADYSGHFVFVCRIISRENEDSLRDPQIDSLAGRFGLNLNESNCLVVITDKSFTVQSLKLYRSLDPVSVVYDAKTRKFWIAGSRYYFKTGSGFRAGLVTLEFADAPRWAYYEVPSSFSCVPKSILVHGDTLELLASQDSVINEIEEQVPVLFSLSTTKKIKQPSPGGTSLFTYAISYPGDFYSKTMLFDHVE